MTTTLLVYFQERFENSTFIAAATVSPASMDDTAQLTEEGVHRLVTTLNDLQLFHNCAGLLTNRLIVTHLKEGIPYAEQVWTFDSDASAEKIQMKLVDTFCPYSLITVEL